MDKEKSILIGKQQQKPARLICTGRTYNWSTFHYSIRQAHKHSNVDRPKSTCLQKTTHSVELLKEQLDKPKKEAFNSN